MLIITRRVDEAIIIDNNTEINILEIKGKQIKIGINAPEDISIYRKEIYLKIVEENKRAATSKTTDLDGFQSFWKTTKK